MLQLLTILFGSPRAILAARVLQALGALCPCHGDAGCEAVHRRAAAAIATAADGTCNPDEAAARLLGTGAHETGFRVVLQVHGPAVTWWQLEVPRRERLQLLVDPVAAARLALQRAGGDLTGYAGCPQGCAAAAELRRYVAAARTQLAAR